MEEIEKYMEMPPTELPESCQFLLECDVAQLQAGSTVAQSYWLEVMKAAKAAGVAVGRRQIWDTRCILDINEGMNDPLQDTSQDLQIQTDNRPGKKAQINQPIELGKQNANNKGDEAEEQRVRREEIELSYKYVGL